uniref:Uncharacterized protein n=1 Tax=Chromera velia CCMP2878 TaxID=1169474 RepID=A0A0G4FI34_9ALVE|eukprot:Cvel_16975.t1-p1 / transcript=Cvel_16975.t1 / gene=Cvel_16975 / organism=Chromera_velia_CCMP2878 / gene_product=hypothetical protein / transcript_product=hypothetical protein / location=Cvel_scaffold1332:45875-49342(-) / protein_length=846 / sequence_SO=supercontig / SO=protein_coding / is_pseudo=false
MMGGGGAGMGVMGVVGGGAGMMGGGGAGMGVMGVVGGGAGMMGGGGAGMGVMGVVGGGAGMMGGGGAGMGVMGGVGGGAGMIGGGGQVVAAAAAAVAPSEHNPVSGTPPTFDYTQATTGMPVHFKSRQREGTMTDPLTRKEDGCRSDSGCKADAENPFLRELFAVCLQSPSLCRRLTRHMPQLLVDVAPLILKKPETLELCRSAVSAEGSGIPDSRAVSDFISGSLVEFSLCPQTVDRNFDTLGPFLLSALRVGSYGELFSRLFGRGGGSKETGRQKDGEGERQRQKEEEAFDDQIQHVKKMQMTMLNIKNQLCSAVKKEDFPADSQVSAVLKAYVPPLRRLDPEIKGGIMAHQVNGLSSTTVVPPWSRTDAKWEEERVRYLGPSVGLYDGSVHWGFDFPDDNVAACVLSDLKPLHIGPGAEPRPECYGWRGTPPFGLPLLSCPPLASPGLCPISVRFPSSTRAHSDPLPPIKKPLHHKVAALPACLGWSHLGGGWGPRVSRTTGDRAQIVTGVAAGDFPYLTPQVRPLLEAPNRWKDEIQCERRQEALAEEADGDADETTQQKPKYCHSGPCVPPSDLFLPPSAVLWVNVALCRALYSHIWPHYFSDRKRNCCQSLCTHEHRSRSPRAFQASVRVFVRDRTNAENADAERELTSEGPLKSEVLQCVSETKEGRVGATGVALVAPLRFDLAGGARANPIRLRDVRAELEVKSFPLRQLAFAWLFAAARRAEMSLLGDVGECLESASSELFMQLVGSASAGLSKFHDFYVNCPLDIAVALTARWSSFFPDRLESRHMDALLMNSNPAALSRFARDWGESCSPSLRMDLAKHLTFLQRNPPVTYHSDN